MKNFLQIIISFCFASLSATSVNADAVLVFELLGPDHYEVPIVTPCSNTDPYCGLTYQEYLANTPHIVVMARLTNIGDEEFFGIGAGLDHNASGTGEPPSGANGGSRTFLYTSDGTAPSFSNNFRLSSGEFIEFALYHTFGMISETEHLSGGGTTSRYYAALEGEFETMISVSMPFHVNSDPATESPDYRVSLDRSFTTVAVSAVPTPPACDINNDGEVNLGDLLLLQRHLLGY